MSNLGLGVRTYTNATSKSDSANIAQLYVFFQRILMSESTVLGHLVERWLYPLAWSNTCAIKTCCGV
jgi:hypothetical protein